MFVKLRGGVLWHILRTLSLVHDFNLKTYQQLPYLHLRVHSVTSSISSLLNVLGLNNVYLESIIAGFHVNL